MMKIPRIKRTAEEIKWNHGNICDEKHTTPRHPKESQTIIGKLCDKKSKSWTSSEKHNHRYDEKHKKKGSDSIMKNTMKSMWWKGPKS